VDIYDVDIGFILTLQDDIIERLRDALLDVITNPPPVIHLSKPDEMFKPSWWSDDYCGTPTGPRPLVGDNVEIEKILDDLPQEWAFFTQEIPRSFQCQNEDYQKNQFNAP
jgi:hypothetical protein